MAKTYTREFKIEVCKLVIEEGIKISVVAENFGVSNIMLYRWLDEYKTYGAGSFVGKGCLKPEDAKFKQLEKENERLKQENEILKKAAAYFAKGSRKD